MKTPTKFRITQSGPKVYWDIYFKDRTETEKIAYYAKLRDAVSFADTYEVVDTSSGWARFKCPQKRAAFVKALLRISRIS